MDHTVLLFIVTVLLTPFLPALLKAALSAGQTPSRDNTGADDSRPPSDPEPGRPPPPAPDPDGTESDAVRQELLEKLTALQAELKKLLETPADAPADAGPRRASPPQLSWVVLDHAGGRTPDGGLFFDSTGIRFRVAFPSGENGARYQVHLRRPDGTTFLCLEVLRESRGSGHAALAREHVASMLETKGIWSALLVNPSTGEAAARHTLDVVDLQTVIRGWRPSLSIGAAGAAGPRNIVYSMSESVRLRVTLNPGRRVPLARYQGLVVTLSARRDGDVSPITILSWPLSGESACWANTVNYPVAALDPGDWRFEIRLGGMVLASAALSILAPETAVDRAEVTRIRVQVPVAGGRFDYLRGRRINRGLHAAVRPTVTLELPCALPGCRMKVRLVVCVDGAPAYFSRKTIDASRARGQIRFGDFPLPKDLHEGEERVYGFALFIGGRYRGHEDFTVFHRRVRVADAEGRLTMEVPDGAIDYAAEAQSIRESLGAA